jgi:hypothetical protein
MTTTYQMGREKETTTVSPLAFSKMHPLCLTRCLDPGGMAEDWVAESGGKPHR